MKLSTFYGGMIGLVVIGGGAMWYASRSNSNTGTVLKADPSDTTVFPGYTIGSPNAPEVVEYGDFVCPVCGSFAVITEPDIRERLVQTGKIRWTYRDRPLSIPGHENAPLAHLAAACANEQGKFWEMHDQMYFNQAGWGEGSGAARKLRGFAEAIHLDLNKYDGCVSEQRYAARIARSAAHADSLGFTGTPTFVFNRHVQARRMSYDEFNHWVDSIIKLTPPPAAPAPAKAKAKTKS